MVNVLNLNEEELEKMALEIETLSRESSKEQLYELIGNSLYDSGLSVVKSDGAVASNYGFLQPAMFDSSVETFSVSKVADYVWHTEPIDKAQAGTFGKNLMKKVKKVICKNTKIAELFTNDGTLKDNLQMLIPLLLTALGFAALTPLALAIIAGIIALVLKIGYVAYCDIK